MLPSAKMLLNFIRKVVVIILLVGSFTPPVSAHNGSHESKNCFINIGNNQLRLSGFQFQGIHPDAVYCRVFPFLDTLLIKLEALNPQASTQQVTLQLVKIDDWLAEISASKASGIVVQTTPQRSFKEVILLQTKLTERGLYALDIRLQAEKQPPLKQRFYFLAGIPITQILVLFSFALLLLLAVLLFMQRTTLFLSKNGCVKK